MKFSQRFERDLYGCHKCVLQLKERAVEKVQMVYSQVDNFIEEANLKIKSATNFGLELFARNQN